MKKIILCLMATVMSLAFIPLELSAKPKIATPPMADPSPVSPAEANRANELLLRLDEIKKADKSELKASEKKELRSEVRTINSELKSIGNGVYLSGAAIIVIIILLVVLL
jgi:hypothetical protein